VVIHLGDVYYSGTEHEMKNYFYAVWQKVLGIPKVEWGSKLTDTAARPATFTLAGNHDMYAGGGPYYTLIDTLGQPASYFCVRNSNWQFIGLDTGLHDANPVGQDVTFLEDSEVAWLKHKIQTAGGRKTVLMSHHQLFSAFEKMDGKPVNEKLMNQLKEILPQVTVWFWGHEHNLTIYKKFQNVLARCVGHGAFPVGVDDVMDRDTSVPIEESVQLSPEQSGALFQHGYAIMELNGPNAKVTYFEYDSGLDQEKAVHSETL
jgi:3',5'-cyclic AMP phosphodiesterase CpdA